VKEKASSYLLEQYKVMEGMEEQHEILKRKLPAILDVISDAEEQASHRQGVKAWLEALKKVAYEANDIFDEFKYEALRREAKKNGHYRGLGMDAVKLFPTHNRIMFRYTMGKKLRRIVQIIEVLVAEMNAFGFKYQRQSLASKQWRQTDSIIDYSEKDIVERSRETEKQKIVRSLLENNDIMVLPIVGMGGLGKTTFAKLIYNEPQIKEHFQLNRWVCVSDEFDLSKIASKISMTTNEKDCDNVLQKLQQEVSGKRFLLVLDDVWNRDVDKWSKLKTCLQQGAAGSVILTTTRLAEVAQIMGTVQAHNLTTLDNRFLWEIIERRAFYLKKEKPSELVDMVDKFVDRCVGSPLAARAVGSVLSNKTTPKEWNTLLSKSVIFDDDSGILPILKLSYDDLPSQMKLCFAFCAIFPKDYEIDVEMLVKLWMANDFIPSENGVGLEKVGNRIFNELARRSFFQDVDETSLFKMYRRDKLCQFRKTCKIHDLMHDIALYVMREECVTVMGRPNSIQLLKDSSRHLFSSYHRMNTLLDAFIEKRILPLRTVMFFGHLDGFPQHLLKYNSLRALCIPNFRGRPCLIQAKHLHHLRYLNLSHSWNMERLPEEISILYNLQTLDLSDCCSLRCLPKNMKYMTSLRHLYTQGCTDLECMPPELRKVTALQTLTYFVVGNSSDCSNVGEIHDLNLGGELELGKLENANEEQAIAANIKEKVDLTHLCFKWSNDIEKDPEHYQNVLGALRPHAKLQLLKVQSFKGTNFPTWMTDVCTFMNLTEIHLVDCPLCKEIPKFWKLPALEVLHLTGLNKLQSLCSGASDVIMCSAFQKLKKLKLQHLKSLKRWGTMEGKLGDEAIFPVLEDIHIKNCPELTVIPEAPKIGTLKLEENKPHLSLLVVGSRYMSLLSKMELSIDDIEAALIPDQSSVETLDDKDIWNSEASVTEMKLDGCNMFFPTTPSKPTVGLWKWCKYLQKLEIKSCDVLIHWPQREFQSLESLNELTVESCKNLKGIMPVDGEPIQGIGQLLPRLKFLGIRNCQELTEIFNLPWSLKTIDIYRCPRLKSIYGKQEDSESGSAHAEQLTTLLSKRMPDPSSSAAAAATEHLLPCLEHLNIGHCDSFTKVPDLPPSLQILHMYNCPNVRFLSGKLDALDSLYISDCKNLRSLGPCLGNLPSLTSLSIYRCKSLVSLPDGPGAYSSLETLEIKYCPAMKSLPGRLQQRLDSLEEKDLSNMRSSDPWEGIHSAFHFSFLRAVDPLCPGGMYRKSGILLNKLFFACCVLLN
jgi:hypothetical protein